MKYIYRYTRKNTALITLGECEARDSSVYLQPLEQPLVFNDGRGGGREQKRGDSRLRQHDI